MGFNSAFKGLKTF